MCTTFTVPLRYLGPYDDIPEDDPVIDTDGGAWRRVLHWRRADREYMGGSPGNAAFYERRAPPSVAGRALPVFWPGNTVRVALEGVPTRGASSTARCGATSWTMT